MGNSGTPRQARQEEMQVLLSAGLGAVLNRSAKAAVGIAEDPINGSRLARVQDLLYLGLHARRTLLVPTRPPLGYLLRHGADSLDGLIRQVLSSAILLEALEQPEPVAHFLPEGGQGGSVDVLGLVGERDVNLLEGDATPSAVVPAGGLRVRRKQERFCSGP